MAETMNQVIRDLRSMGKDIGKFWMRKPINIFLYKQMSFNAC